MKIFKRISSLILGCVLLLSMNVNVMAVDKIEVRDKNIIATDYEYLSDGSFYETITYVNNEMTRGSRTSSKITTFYNGDKKAMWYVKVTATFTYNGSTSKCTSATADAESYVNTWRIDRKSASRGGNSATATATAQRLVAGTVVETVTKSVTLSCDKNGNLS